MAKRIVKLATVTGADDSVSPEQLIGIARRFPFVEFGILLAKKQQGSKRFPSRNWLDELYILWRSEKIALSGHICGSWVRNLCVGMPNFFEDFGDTWKMFNRIQLNFHAEPHVINARFLEVLREMNPRQIILQMDGVNQGIYNVLTGMRGIDAVPLFDLSGGDGVLPKAWPKWPDSYCGDAGGLSPDNIAGELEKIAEATGGHPIWVDIETHVRSENDTKFDLKKVSRFLEKVEPWVI